MRSNTLSGKTMRQVRKAIDVITQAAKTFIDWLMLGLSGRQWLASLLIGLLLLSIFSLPVQATVYVGSNAETSAAGNFEPVNAPQWFWETAWMKLNAKTEEWLTPRREGNTCAAHDLIGSASATNKTKNDEVLSKVTAADNNNNEKISKVGSKLTKEKSSTAALKNNASAVLPKTRRALPVPESPRPILADGELRVLTSPKSNLGNPVGQAEATSTLPAVATRTAERYGIGNFNFGLPIASLTGRGLDASVGFSYNSQLWTKSSDGNSGYNYTFNVDGNWLAPGFQLTYGYLDKYSGRFILTGSDGTRTQLNPTTNPDPTSTETYYQADDGSFTGAFSSTAGVKIAYTDGTRVEYGLANSQQRRYPTKITDRHGNYISIAYLTGDNSGKITDITDTLGRHILFHYDDTTQKLIAVSVPGYGGVATRRQTIRFYYEDLPLQTTNRFSGSIDAPATVSVLKYVYFPGVRTGYRYYYSPYYGMIYKIGRLEGMQVTGGDSLTQMGTVTEGSYLESASTRYNYPGTDIEPPAPTLTDVPKYDKRTDDWQGRTGTAPQTIFTAPVENLDANGIGTRTTQVGSPDGTTSISVAKVKPGQWDDGLTTESSLTAAGRTLPWTKTILTWEPGTGTVGRRNPRIHKIETANEVGQTKATIFGYDYYNNQNLIKQLDFAPAGQEGAELNKTEITYLTDPYYTYYNRLVRLPVSVKKTVGTTVVSRTDYDYDQYPLTNRTDVAQYNPAFNPYINQTTQCNCHWVCDIYVEGDSGRCAVQPRYECDLCNSHDPNRDKRGNVTKITAFVDPTNNSDPNASVTTFKYDITGNTTEASLNCCNIKTWQYDAANQYAYPVSETKGTGGSTLTTSAEYNFPTGLVTKTKDENNQETIYEYETDTLRQKKATYPNGGYTQTEYSDKLISDSQQLVPGFVKTTTTLDANKTAQSYSYFDARGLPLRTATNTPDGWSVSATEYDNLSRPKKSYNPFYASTPTGAIPDVKGTEVLSYDGLSRTTAVKLQDDTTVATAYNGTVITVTDQAGKQRRQTTDALGRVARVDEPDANGNLDANGVPAQPTGYEYDGNDNLIKVTQTGDGATQERLFRYDALSRLTHERQVEATATLNDDGVKVTTGGLWTKVLKYDPHSLLTDGYDARGVNTHFAYDGINRVQTVTFSDGTPTVTYTYDQARTGFFNKGALTRVETAEGNAATRPDTPATATELDYDSMGRVKGQRQAIGTQTYNLAYGYNLAGQLVSETYPSGKVVSTNYDANGRLASVADQSRTYLNSVGFLGKGNNVNSMVLGNGTEQGFAYNDRLQLQTQTLTKPYEILQQYDYGYGQIDGNGILDTTKNNGQLARVESRIGSQQQWTQKFAYDSLGRLAEAKEYKGDTTTLSYQQNFDYDRFGNLYRKATANPTAGQESPLPFTPIENADISKNTNRFTTNTNYDDAGNVVQDTKFRSLKFAYDANGRMIKTSNVDNMNEANSIYDASGMRVATRVYDEWKFFIYDASGKMVAEYGGTPATDEGGVRYVFTDWQGSTRAIVGNSGFVQARQDFTAFGEQIAGNVGLRAAQASFNANSNLNQKYALTERDTASGLDHTWWRKLENRSGRWTSPDPYNGSMKLGNPQSFNRYSYVSNQPTNFVDPSGLLQICFGYHITYVQVRRDRDGNIVEVISSTYGGFIPTLCINIGGTNSPSGRGGSGNNKGNGKNGQSSGKKKCKQDENGGDKNDIEAKLNESGLAGFISNVETRREGVTFTINDRAGFLAALNSNTNFRHNTPFGALHAGDVGANIFTVSDFRSFTSGSNTLGADSTGVTRSLQVNVGPNRTQTNPDGSVRQVALGYADLDCDNPAQDVVSFIRHIGSFFR